MKQKHTKRTGSHGAVTIFLTLVLIPCMIFVCAFGDVSRVALSKSQAVAAADLALYSLMANYDEALKEWYGLVAGCKDMDSFYSVTKEYFVGMMDANGLDDTASSTIVAYLDAVRDGDFSSFLKVSGLDSVTVEPMDDGAMGENPALIEDGIVEFMKYRGPIVIAEKIVDRFSQMDFSGLLDANENQPVVNAKQDFAMAEGQMMTDLLHSYLAILVYDEYYQENGFPSIDAYKDIDPKLDAIKTDLSRMTEVITKYYAATDGIKDLTASPNSYGNFAKFTLPDTTYLNNDGDAAIYYNDHIEYFIYLDTIGAVDDGEGNYSISDSAVNSLFSQVDDQITNIQNAASNIVTSCSGITVPTYGTGETPTNGVNDAVYCMRIQNAVETSDLNTIINNGKDLMQTYVKILLLSFCDMSDAAVQTVNTYKNMIESAHTDYLSWSNPNTDYETLVKNYHTAAVDKRAVKKTTEMLWPMKSEYCGEELPIGSFLQELRDEFGPILEHLDTQINNLNIAINGISVNYHGTDYDVVSLDTLRSEINDCNTKRSKWGSTASTTNTDYGEKEYEEYSGDSETYDLPPEIYENHAICVQVLKDRLVHIQADMIELRDVLNGMVYGGTSVWELNRTTAVTAAKTVVPTTVDPNQPAYISINISDNESAATGYFEQLYQGGDYVPPEAKYGEDGNIPELRDDPPILYEYMTRKFPLDQLDTALEAKDEWDKDCEKNDEEAKKASEQSQGLEEAYLDDLGEDLKETSGGESYDFGTALTGLVGVVEKLLSGNFDEFRDQIYVVSYIMEMFSYSSYDNEGEYNLSEDPLTLNDYDTTKSAFPDYLDPWHEEDPTKFTKNKSLTNNMINSKNNYSNLAEVEYILFGNDTNEQNLKDAYAQVFAVREALNLISGFMNFYFPNDPENTTATLINTIAADLMAATCGVVPIPVTKVVLIGILATMESAHDLTRLKAGIPVAVFKDYKHWFFSLSGRSPNEGIEKPDENGVFYSDYLLLFLLISTNDEDLYSDMLLRVGDLVEQNVQTGAGKTDFDLDTAQCYFKLTGTLKVEPLLLSLPLVTNYTDVDSSSLLSNTDWCTYSLSVIRGYS